MGSRKISNKNKNNKYLFVYFFFSFLISWSQGKRLKEVGTAKNNNSQVYLFIKDAGRKI